MLTINKIGVLEIERDVRIRTGKCRNWTNSRLPKKIRKKSATGTSLPATISNVSESQDDLYQQAAKTYGDSLDRLVRAYELDPDKRRDLLQEIHLGLWRSFEKYEARCSLRTWVYWIAHNVEASPVIRQRRARPGLLLSLEEIDSIPDRADREQADQRMDLERLFELIHQLHPPDRELMLLYLEDLDAPAIGEIMGTSAVNVRSKIHRIKAILSRRLNAGVRP